MANVTDPYEILAIGMVIGGAVTALFVREIMKRSRSKKAGIIWGLVATIIAVIVFFAVVNIVRWLQS